MIRLANRMDAGNILAQSTIPIGPTETAGELHDRLAEDGVALANQTIALAGGTAVESPQDESRATTAPRMSRAEAHIDFTRPDQTAQAICQRIRGTWPWPGCHFHLLDAAGDRFPALPSPGPFRPLRMNPAGIPARLRPISPSPPPTNTPSRSNNSALMAAGL